ncbi:MAG: type VI secretion system baseplate subunit TssG, partial [Planctomycetes bacterium]|nr:type VI secretion system baseplate subunit TssG [Planctomycetota bacterium]
RLARKDSALVAFLDLFNHRLVSLFYRAWEKYQFWMSSERMLYEQRQAVEEGESQFRSFVLDQRPRFDPFGEMLLSLVGLGAPSSRYVLSHRDSLQPRTEIADQTWRYYAGLVSNRHRPAVNLESILSDHFQLPVRIRSLCGRWLHLETADQTRLKAGCNSKLGQETVAGKKVWEVQGKYRIEIGPLSYDEFCELLPIGTAHRPVAQIARFFAGFQLDFDIDLQLKTTEIPPLRCGDTSGIGPRLGWNTWLKSRKFDSDTESVKLRPYDDDSNQNNRL